MAAHILVIDDELPLLESVTDILELSGYDISIARNGAAGIEQMQAHPPQLILCDLMMPGINGHEVLEAARADESTAHIPFVLVSAKADPETIRASLNQGAADFLVKPFAYQELMDVVRRHLPS